MAEQLFPVTIAGFTAFGFSVPDGLPIGGVQRLGVHQLPAGVRIVDSLGPDDADIIWKGMLIQQDPSEPRPLDTARYLDYQRKLGAPVTLSWDVFQYTVVIERFHATYEYTTRILFEITMKVIEDKASPTDSFQGSSTDSLVQSDYSNIMGNAPGLNMNVPSGMPTSFSTTPGAEDVGPSAVTWDDGASAATNPDGSAIPVFNTKDEADNYALSRGDGYSADYLTDPQGAPVSTGFASATNPDGSPVPTFTGPNAKTDAHQWLGSRTSAGYSANYVG